MTTRSCQDTEELLAAFAAGGLEGSELADVQAHVDSCRSCRDEVAAIERVLVRTRAAVEPRKAMDEVFWRDFSQTVTSACDKVSPPPSRLGWATLVGWLRRPVVMGGFCAVAAALLLFAYVKKPEDMGRAPVIAVGHEHGPGHAVDPKPLAPRPAQRLVVEDDDSMLDLTPAQLTAVLHSFEPAEDEAPDEETLAIRDGGASAVEAIENLSDDELARVYAAL